MKNIDYGLHPTIWRKIRAKVGCVNDIQAYNKDNKRLCLMRVSRYQSYISLPDNIDFKDISWENTINHLKSDPDCKQNGFLGSSVIPVGVNHI
jgi:hypothetical protein